MSTSTHLARFFKHSSVYVIGNLLNRVGAFLLLPLYTHYLTVAEYGALELFYAVMGVISGVLSIGLAHATLRFYFEYKEPADRQALISTNLIASFAISAIGVALMVPWSHHLGEWIFGDQLYTHGIYLVLATIVFELSSQVSLAYLRAIERSGLFVAISVGKLLVQVAANAYLVMVAHAGVEGVLLGNLLTVVAGWAVLTFITVKQCGFSFHREKAGPVLRYSYPFLLSTIVGLISANADRFLINSFMSTHALGLYALSMKFCMLLQELIGEPFNRAYGAFRFSIMNDNNAGPIQARIVRYLLVITATGALGIAYFMEDLLRIISAPEYWPAAKIVPVLLVASILKVLSYPLQTGILYKKQTGEIFQLNVLVAVVSILSNLLLIPAAGLDGACAALVVTSIFAVVLTNRMAQRHFNVKYDYQRWFMLAMIASGYFALGLLTARLPQWYAFASKVALLIGFVATVFISPVFERGEIRSLRSLRSLRTGLESDKRA